MKCIDEKYRYISETVKYTCIVRLHEIRSLFSILWLSKKPIKIYSGFRSYRTLLTLTFSNSLRTDIGLHIYYNLRSSKCINLSILHPVSACWVNSISQRAKSMRPDIGRVSSRNFYLRIKCRTLFFVCEQITTTRKMLYNLNTNWKCVYIHRKLSLSEA